ncbi:hypothetical protein F9282_08040 [Proteus terrae subsp. cibarius]|nr:hypothetical protein F9282_08040 [Proteus terrae subsp. cibarius]QHP78384.1 hypothetical protein EKQ45_09795 [Proteus vulgaris]
MTSGSTSFKCSVCND